jgi:ferredoxin
MKVSIERDSCTGCAVCWQTCPELFESSPEDGFSEITELYRSEGRLDQGIAPDSLSECTGEAADNCPVGIIHVSEK